jgi:dCTP deaminase
MEGPMVLPKQHLRDISFGENPMILADGGLDEKQISIASVDCRLGDVAYAMKSAALPHGEKVAHLIKRYTHFKFKLSENETSVLQRGVSYIIPLREHLALSPEFYAVFSPKSSTGRADIFVRVLTDKFAHYDKTDFGYKGLLYLEVTPLSFNVRICSGLELTQFRVRTRSSQAISKEDLASLHAKYGILRGKDGRSIPNGKLNVDNGSLYYHIDLERDIVGFEAVPSPIEELDMTLSYEHDPEDFWRPIMRPRGGELVLTPNVFCLLATVERTVIPPEVCGEILPYEVSSGEFRSHYAGFFDNGFGSSCEGTVGVLEVRGREFPFRLKHGQPICRMDFERTLEVPEELYAGHYTQSGPSLSKHFRDRFDVWEL